MIPWNKGKTGIYSEETIKQMSDSRKKKMVGKKHFMWGKHHSEESKRKMSESKKGIPAWNKGLPNPNKGLHRVQYVQIQCRNCGETFMRQPSRRDDKYCSNKCKYSSIEFRRMPKRMSPPRFVGAEWHVHHKPETVYGGEQHWNWKGGISSGENKKLYNSFMGSRRKARKLGNGGSHTIDDWKMIKEKYNFTCPSCHRQEPEIKLTEDHIIPLSKGGSDGIENIQPLCISCNVKKHTKTIKYELANASL